MGARCGTPARTGKGLRRYAAEAGEWQVHRPSTVGRGRRSRGRDIRAHHEIVNRRTGAEKPDVRLNRSDRIAGLPAEAARELMRQFRTPRPESGISFWVVSDGRADAEIAQALAADGWLKVNVEDLDGETWWETTTKG